ncbi:ribosomal protein S10 domain-containing protein [Coemansia spiralis]|nr:ribosomal protein S10 domain-containing protein [Coemansia spiralis]
MYRTTVSRAAAGCNALKTAFDQVPRVTAGCGLQNPMAVRGARTEATYMRLLDKALGFNVREKVPTKEVVLDDPLYEKPPRVAQTHGIRVCRVAFRSFQLHRMDFYMDFAIRAAYHMGIPIAGPVSMPVQIRRWTVLKSPFVHKSSMEVFERRTHKRVLILYDANPEVVKKWLDYINENIPVGIGMKYWLTEHEPLDISEQINKALKTGEAGKVDPSMLETTNYLQKIVRRGRGRQWTTYKDLPTFSKANVEQLAMNVVNQLKMNPKANIEEITRQAVSGSKGSKKASKPVEIPKCDKEVQK